MSSGGCRRGIRFWRGFIDGDWYDDMNYRTIEIIVNMLQLNIYEYTAWLEHAIDFKQGPNRARYVQKNTMPVSELNR